MFLAVEIDEIPAEETIEPSTTEWDPQIFPQWKRWINLILGGLRESKPGYGLRLLSISTHV